MTFTIGRKIGLGFAIALLALLAIGLSAYINLSDNNLNAAWVTHTVDVQQRLQGLTAAILQAESSARGYNLVPDARFKDLSKRARVEITSNFRALRILVQDNSIQENRLDRLEPLMTSRLDSLQRLMDLRDLDSGAPDTKLGPLVTDGAQTMAETRQIISDLMGEEQRLLKIRQDRAARGMAATFFVIIFGTSTAFLLVGATGWAVTRSITYPLGILGEGAGRIGGGDYAHRVSIRSRDEVGHLAGHFNLMAAQVEDRQMAQADQDWLKTSLARFSTLFQGRRNPDFVCRSILAELAGLLEARHSVMYIPDRNSPDGTLKLQASYAADGAPAQIKAGEGLIGQCFVDKERIVLTDIPADYLRVNSALGETPPRAIAVQPALFEGKVKAVIEIAALEDFAPLQLTFLSQLAESVGIVLHTIEGALRTEELLAQSQLLSKNLQAQQAELSTKNDELEANALQLRSSELLLQEQQEELKQTNEELEQANEEMQQTNEEMEEKVNLLAMQKREMERANLDLEQAREEVEEKAEQVALASKYKSEFLASMSHELRTPLNSLLILSKILSDNTLKNLDAKQVQYAKTIYSSGNDLLELINEILDLSKIESGAVEIEPSDVHLSQIKEFVEQSFRHIAETKRLEFEVQLEAGLPPTIQTDIRRLEQILKNLLANAFKFTEKGRVTLKMSPTSEDLIDRTRTSGEVPAQVAFAVNDTGIGIPPGKQKLIFEAFQQADSGTARKYGGTGLGLSISRELAGLLGGALQVASKEGEGSTFTLRLPVALPAKTASGPTGAAPAQRQSRPRPNREAGERIIASEAPSSDNDGMNDDRADLVPGDSVLLVIEDDRNFANIMMEFARKKNFKVLVARNAAQGVAWARHANPAAITLDLHLPDNDGWVVLDQLKHDPKTRHIPIHIISVDEERERSLRLGAVSYFQKPVTRETVETALNQTIEFINRPLKNLLIIEDDPAQRQSMVELIGNGDVHSTAVGSAAEAFRVMDVTHFDCVVLDLGLPDQNGLELIREIHARYGATSPPIIVYTGKELSREEETELRMIAESIVIKNVRSPERLLDETALFLHRVQAKLPEPKRKMIEQGQKTESILSGRKVLVVDDDVRNIFAITSALETSGMRVAYAESGQAGIDLLTSETDIEVVLMDVMMPGMDGFETIRRIRKIDKFKKLPIISVTAKAMKGDREKCLEAGASDYVTKPVDMDQLRSLLRVWLYR